MTSGYNLTPDQRRKGALILASVVLIVLAVFVFRLAGIAKSAADPTDIEAFEPKVRAVLILFDMIAGAVLTVVGVASSAVLWFILDRTKLGARLMHWREDVPESEPVRAARIQAGGFIFLGIALVVSAVVLGVLK